MKYSSALLASIFSASLLLSACSSGSDSAAKEADITADNAKDLAVAATESTKQAVASEGAPSIFKTSASQFDTQSFSEKLVQQVQPASDPYDFNSLCTGGGSASSNFSSDGTNGTISFNSCDMGFGTIVNGSVSFQGNYTSSGGSYSIEYNNFTVTYNGITETIDFSMDCTYNNQGDSSCTTSSTAMGIDGRTYTVKNIDVSGDDMSGYNMTAEVVDPDYGTISVNATAVKFDCAAGTPSSGSITFSAGGKTGTVTFDSCSSFTVTIDDGAVSTTYNWADITAP